jgi:hypothetical protein
LAENRAGLAGELETRPELYIYIYIIFYIFLYFIFFFIFAGELETRPEYVFLNSKSLTPGTQNLNFGGHCWQCCRQCSGDDHPHSRDTGWCFLPGRPEGAEFLVIK